MRRVGFIAIFALTLMAMFSCDRESESEGKDLVDNVQVVTITAVREGYEGVDGITKTVRQEDGSVFWNGNDKISLFYGAGENGGNRFTINSEEVCEVAEFEGVDPCLGSSSKERYWAVYPYSKENTCDGNSVSINVPKVQTALDGTFANNLFPTIGVSDDTTIPFFNVCGGVKFSVSRTGIKSITFKGNNAETLAGKVKVGFGQNSRPEVLEYIDRISEVTLLAPNGETFEIGRYYYFILLPGALTEGFTMTFTTADGNEGKYIHKSSVIVKRSVFGVIDEVDKYVKSWKTAPVVSGGWSTGSIYLGIIGFNEALYPYTMGRLSDDTKNRYTSFVDNLKSADATVLYYAVDNAIDVLHNSMYPEDIQDIAIITFTDGLDEGSIMLTDKYEEESDYLDAISYKLASSKIGGLPISSYTIAMRGNVAASNLERFRNDLKKIASSDENATEFANMEEVSVKFEELANLISRTNNVQTIPLKCIGRSSGTRMRFVLDGASSASGSNVYIEGVFHREGKVFSLRDIVYCGLISTSGTIVYGEQSGVNVVFTFEGLRRNDLELIETEDISFWWSDDTMTWQKSAETPPESGENGIINEKQSIAVMLVLDCSNSLNNSNRDFDKMKIAAKEFISILCDNSVDENAVASVRLDRYAVEIPVGGSLTLNATVHPTTALHRDVIWSSNNTAVASVDAMGTITAHSKGEAYIYAITEDGAKTAVCLVNVPQYAESLEIHNSSAVLYTGENIGLNVTVLPEDTSDKRLVWSSSDSKVATVDENGIVTALKAGSAMIYAETIDGSNLRASCALTVKQHVTGLFMDESSIVIGKGCKRTLVATIIPSDATDKSLIWSSSNESVVTVDSNGLITGVGKGNAVVTVASKDGGSSVDCDVTVIQYVEKILLNTYDLVIDPQSSFKLVADVYPEDANNKELKWSSSNEDVVTVNDNGVISSIKEGSALIIVESTDGSQVTQGCQIIVKRQVTGISVSPSDLILEKGEYCKLVAEISPSDASDKSIVWTTSNQSVATVTSLGVVRAGEAGVATITAKTVDGSYTATCTVTVPFSTNLSEVSIAVSKENVFYFLNHNEYRNCDLSGYLIEGIALPKGKTSTNYPVGAFILSLHDESFVDSENSVQNRYSLQEAKDYITMNVLPDNNECYVIYQNLSEVNTMLRTLDASIIHTIDKNDLYWTSSYLIVGEHKSFWGYHFGEGRNYRSDEIESARVRLIRRL